MTRIVRDFSIRPRSEQALMTTNTWCDSCQDADLGLRAPLEYEEGGRVYLEGTCIRCGARVRSEIHETDNR